MKKLNTEVKIESATIITPTSEVNNIRLMEYYSSLYELLKTNASGHYNTIKQN